MMAHDIYCCSDPILNIKIDYWLLIFPNKCINQILFYGHSVEYNRSHLKYKQMCWSCSLPYMCSRGDLQFAPEFLWLWPVQEFVCFGTRDVLGRFRNPQAAISTPRPRAWQRGNTRLLGCPVSCNSRGLIFKRCTFCSLCPNPWVPENTQLMPSSRQTLTEPSQGTTVCCSHTVIPQKMVKVSHNLLSCLKCWARLFSRAPVFLESSDWFHWASRVEVMPLF